MNDLIHKLQHYDMMKPRIAKQEFQRSLFYDGNEQFIIIGNPKNMVAFLYTSKIVERSITDHYLNHTARYYNYCFNHTEVVRFTHERCYNCKQPTTLKLINNTGVPHGTKCISNFYVYCHETHIEQKIDDRLVIVQQLNNFSMITTLQLQHKHDMINRQTLTLFIKWLCNRDAILAVSQGNLLPELRIYIINYLVII